jgi:hypothetical protein
MPALVTEAENRAAGADTRLCSSTTAANLEDQEVRLDHHGNGRGREANRKKSGPTTTDAAFRCIGILGLTELALAMRMSQINMEQMRFASKATNSSKAAAAFLKTMYYKRWSRAQLNNTE